MLKIREKMKSIRESSGKQVKHSQVLLHHKVPNKQTSSKPTLIFEQHRKEISGPLRILDLGCGNGRLLASFKNLKIDYLGIDNSIELLKIAQETYPKRKFREMEMTSLELKDDTFDACFAVASLHHLSTKLLRRKALSEAFRVTKKGGYFFVTVWNLWQPKYRKFIFKNIFNMIFRNPGDLKRTPQRHFGDTFIPFKNKDQKILAKRYYFAYTKRGLKKDLEASGFYVTVISKSRWNFYAICRK